jgi:thymidylate synthase
LDVVAVIHDEDPNDLYLPAWVPLTPDQLAAYYPQLLTPTRPENIAYTYGERLFDYNGRDQVADMVTELRAQRFSRRAVAGLWDPARDPHSVDPPCLNLVQMRIREGKLYLTAYFRSHDIFRAWLLNTFGLRRLQAEIAARVSASCMLGDLVVISQSAHIYADSWEAARSITQAHEREYLKNPRLVRDPRGSLTIRLEGFQIHVDHYSPAGNLLATFSGSTARALQRELAPFVSRIDHAIYLGVELGKAELALKNGWTYIQDQDLSVRVESGQSGENSPGQRML